LDYAIPPSQPGPQPAQPYGLAIPQNVAPGTYNPWAAPLDSNSVGSGASAAFLATDTTQGLVLEERPLPASRISKGEIAFWAFAVLLASTVTCHRNGVLRQWFGANSYALLEAQVLGKPGIDTVAGVQAYLTEFGGATPTKSTTNLQRPSR